MKIISLTSENVKRLKAVRITPTGNVVQITGRNGQGKTSVLDSIWWCLAGAGTIQKAPIRKGQERAVITLDLDELVVTRTFKRSEGDSFTTKIVVETKDGGSLRSPQERLDGLLGSLTFDPLAFARLGSTPEGRRKQFDMLRQFVPGIDFDKIDEANRSDTERRTTVNRLAKEARAAAGMILVPDDIPEELVDEQALIAELQEAGDQNTETERRRANRERVAREVEAHRSAAAAALAAIETDHQELCAERDRDVEEIEAQISALQMRLQNIKNQYLVDYETVRRRRTEESTAATAQAEEKQAKLDTAEPLPEVADTASIAQRIESARKANQIFERAQQRNQHVSTAEKYEAEAAQLTENIRARTKAKADAIAAAEMPVTGIDFGDGFILLNGVPFDQASDAERLRASVAIAMAMTPKLRVIRIRDGSLLDEDAMKLLGEMADEHDMQVWIERVDSSGTVGFVLEDGEVREAETSASGAAA